jgi:tetratricopeptide (TPR) repeat protein
LGRTVFTAAFAICLGLWAEPVRFEPVLARRYEDLLRRIGALDVPAAAEVPAIQADVAALAPEIEVIDPARAAALWSRFARRARRAGALDAAADAHARAAEVSRKSSDSIGAALALHESAMSLRASGKSAAALGHAAEAARLFAGAGARSSEALARIQSGRLLEDLGRWQEASREYKKVLRLDIDLGGRRVQTAEVLNRLGLALAEAGQESEATRCFAATDRLCAELEDPERSARLSMDRVRAHERKERLDEALGELERAAGRRGGVDTARKAGKAGKAGAAGAGALPGKGRPADAVRFLDAAIAALETPGDEASLTEAIIARARALAQLGRVDEAVRDWNDGLARARGREGPLRIAQLLISRAADMTALGRIDDALRDVTEGLEAFEELGLGPLVAAATRARAALLARLGRLARAIDDLTRAEKLHSCLEDRAGRNIAALRRAGLLAELGRREEALLEYERLIPDLEKDERKELLTQGLMESGALLSSLGRAGAALQRFEAASAAVEMDGTDEERDVHAIERAKVLVDLGRCAEALEALEPWSAGPGRLPAKGPAAAELRAALALLQRGRALRGLGRADEAVAAFGGAERLSASLGGQEIVARARAERGGVHLEAGEARQGVRELEGAAEALEDALVRSALSPEAESPALADESRRIVASAMRALRETGSSRDVLASAYRAAQVFRGTRMAAFAGRRQTAGADAVQRALPAGTALVEIVDDGEAVTAFVLMRATLEAVALGKSAEITPEVERALEALETEASLRGLGRRVLDPVLARLPPGAVRTLLIAPDGALSRVPLEALLTADPPPGADRREWPHLVKTFAVAHVHSGTAIVESAAPAKEPRTRGRRRFVAFASAGADGAVPPPPEGSAAEKEYPEPAGSRRIPPALLEALSIARLFAGEKHLLEILKLESRLGSDPPAVPGEFTEGVVTLFLEEGAAEKAFRTRAEVKDARVLHVSCPLRADLDSPLLSHLVLRGGTGPEAEDGRLTPGELGSLDIGPDLLVLSGCQPTGSRRPFEGLFGLPRAGIAAGARSVLSTLHRAEGEGARELLAQFYRLWTEGSTTRIGALATAKRMAIKDGTPIATWSAYILWDTEAADR